MNSRKDNPTDVIEKRLDKELHLLKGYHVILRVSRCTDPKKLNVKFPDDPQDVSIKILYCGAAVSEEPGVFPEQDPRLFAKLWSPFPQKLEGKADQGFFADREGNLWIGYYAQVFLKDAGLYSSGLKVEIDVPEILKKKNPEFQVICNDRLLYRETLSSAGTHSMILDIREVNHDLSAYMANVRRLQYTVLNEFERICKKYSVQWYMICGGLIGVLRDGDLIPWDDDLDIAVTRADYEKLSVAVKEEWTDSSEYLWLRPEDYGNGIFYDFMTRIVYQKEEFNGDVFSRIQGYGRNDIHRHVVLDIYILENAGNSRIRHQIQVIKLQLLYLLLLGHRPFFDPEEHTDYGKLTRRAADKVRKIGRKIPVQRLWNAYKQAIQKYPGKNGTYYYLSNGYYRCFRMRFRREWFGSGKTIRAGNRDICAPLKAERYLRTMYGDYTQYPSAWNRDPSHRQL